jgi:hypothetical protein
MANADLEAGGWEVWPNTACISRAELNTRGRKSQAADVSDGATPTVRSRALKMSTFANVQ